MITLTQEHKDTFARDGFVIVESVLDELARTLGVDRERTVTTYPKVANCGPMLMPANAHLAAVEGQIRPGSVVLFFSVGSVSSTSSAVMRWGNVGLGARPW